MAWQSKITGGTVPGTQSFASIDVNKLYTNDEHIRMIANMNNVINFLNAYLPALEKYLGTYTQQ